MTLRKNTFLTAGAVALALALAGCSDNEDSDATIEQPAPDGAPLKVEVYNPGESGIFEVSSALITGKNDAVLVDAQFSTVDGAKLVERIKASGKRLTTIYISHGDPDYYFGLVTVTDAFPEAKVLATPQTIAHIRETAAAKLQVWSPQLGAGAPRAIVVPGPVQGDKLDLEGNALEIVGLDGPTPDRTVLWIPSIKTVLGGIPVISGEHVWMADTQTPQSHVDWLAMLDRIAALNPETVVPGHFKPGSPQTIEAVRFTGDYIRTFDQEAAKARNSGELIAALKVRYPGLGGEASLELSAKVAKGEMTWP